MENRKEPPTFILLGAAGYVAPRHMAAIKEIGGELVAAVDPNPTVGILDAYFPKCRFFRDHLDAFEQVKADYVVICTPNHQHALQACQAMQAGMDVIVEKPAAITTRHVNELIEVEYSTGRRVNCILNLRLHHDAQLLNAICRKLFDRAVVDIEYHTPRGDWYAHSWKSQQAKSGGILFNIGIHLLDLSMLAFGSSIYPASVSLRPVGSVAKVLAMLNAAGGDEKRWLIGPDRAMGILHLQRADVFVRLSINGRPKQRTFTVNGAEFDFTHGFEDLHAESYRRIIRGQGFSLNDAKPAIELCERIGSNAHSRE